MPAHAHRAYVDAWMALFEKRLFLAAREVSALAFRLAATEEELARTYNQMGLIELHLRQAEQAGPHFERGLAVVADESITRIKLLNNRAIADFYLGDIDSAWQRSQLAYEWCRSTPRVPHALRGDVTWTLGYLALIRQQWERAIDWSRQAVASFNSTGQWLGRAHALNNLGVAEFELNDAENAEKHQREALYAFARLGAAGEAYKAYAYAQLGRIFFTRGDLAQTAAFGGQALRALWTHMGLLDKREVGQVCELHGYIAWSGNDRKETISQLQRASTYYLQRHFFQDWARVNQVMERVIAGERTPVVESVRPTPGDQQLLRYFTSMLGFLDSLEGLHPQLAGRSQLVTNYALVLGEALGFAQSELEALSHAARLYDIGYTSIEGEVGEVEISHALLGERLLRMFAVPHAAVLGVRHHHERFDGQGGPDRLAGSDIPISARIIAVVDTYVREAGLEQGDPWRGHTYALEELRRRAGRELDPDVVETFIGLHPHSVEVLLQAAAS